MAHWSLPACGLQAENALHLLGFVEQMRRFVLAALIIGMHGAALSHICWAHPKARNGPTDHSALLRELCTRRQTGAGRPRVHCRSLFPFGQAAVLEIFPRSDVHPAYPNFYHLALAIGLKVRRRRAMPHAHAEAHASLLQPFLTTLCGIESLRTLRGTAP